MAQKKLHVKKGDQVRVIAGRSKGLEGKIIQVFPNDDALLRLVTAVLFELHDEWIAFPSRYLPEGSMDQLYPAELLESAPALPNTTNTTAG